MHSSARLRGSFRQGPDMRAAAMRSRFARPLEARRKESMGDFTVRQAGAGQPGKGLVQTVRRRISWFTARRKVRSAQGGANARVNALYSLALPTGLPCLLASSWLPNP